jgi:starch phosphorylase
MISPVRGPIAYFTMEVALDDDLPTYSGGLGVLAGDYLRSAADLGFPVVGMTLCYRGGYFSQQLDGEGHQSEEGVSWQADRDRLLERLPGTVAVSIGDRRVRVGVRRIHLEGVHGDKVPVYFLDTDLEENDPSDRDITDRLYGGDDEHRLRQEAVLGIGGVEMLRRLGYGDVPTFHMNEGHSALLTLRLLEEEMAAGDGGSALPGAPELEAVRRRCVFTTHTPVPAGHDRFSSELVRRVLGEARGAILDHVVPGGVLNMTDLGAGLSRYVNAVSRRHRSVAQSMLPSCKVRSVTNGVRVATWASPAMQELFDGHLPGWRADAALLRYASSIPLEDVVAVHTGAKKKLLADVTRRTGASLPEEGLTIGLARRVTPYKQTTLLFTDPGRLAAIAEAHGPINVVASGKAHPRDIAGKELIAGLFRAAAALAELVRLVFIENYDLNLAARMCAGTDLWLNTPKAPLEASGTSGMKAALNGVPSLSVLDGWWLEGCIEGVTGWAVGHGSADADDAEELYSKLEEVAGVFFGGTARFDNVRRNAISLNGSFFNTDRMAREYALAAYSPSGADEHAQSVKQP